MNLDPQAIAGARVAPDHCVVPNRAARRVIQSGKHGVADLAAHFQVRHEAGDLLGTNHSALDSQETISFRPNAQAVDPSIGVSQGEVSTLIQEDVPLQFARHLLVQFQRRVVERDPFGRAVVRTQYRRITPTVSASEIALFQDGNLPSAMLFRQIVRGRQTMHSRSDDHDVVGVSQVVGLPHPFLAKELFHTSDSKACGLNGQTAVIFLTTSGGRG